MNNRKSDYYKILDLNRDCNAQEIRKSFRALALRWHPDKHVDKVEADFKFNEIREAYSVLIDPKQRQIYDLYGHQGIQNFQENNGFSDHPNVFLAKGFQGTEKSAFDILLDILQEKEDDIFDQTDSSDQMPSGFKTDFFGLFESRATSEVEEDHFLNNYQPTFTRSEFCVPPQEYTSLLARQTSSDFLKMHQNTLSQHHSTAETNANKTRTNTGLFTKLLSPKSGSERPAKMQQANSPNTKNMNIPFVQRKASIIIIDDDDDDDNVNSSDYSQQPVSPWIAQLNEFQTILDQFHHNLEENLLNFNKVSPNSKKINKREKLNPSSQPAKNGNAGRFSNRPIPTYS